MNIMTEKVTGLINKLERRCKDAVVDGKRRRAQRDTQGRRKG
jgi:hypothetical protein